MNRNDIIKTQQGKKYKAPKCSVCGVVYKHHKFIGGRMIKNICNCNQNLLDEETNRIIQAQKAREESPDYKGARTLNINI